MSVMSVKGVGIDTVHLPSFRDQLADPASRFVAMTFTPAEQALAEGRPDKNPARHLAARFAAKEAFLKAWSGARWGKNPTAQSSDLRDIEVVCDAWDRPRLVLHGAVAAALAEAAPRGFDLQLSLSHDGDQAMAMVVLSAPEELR
ncbi:MAG: holo-ACP synthase [Myxococcota bacterium]